MHFVIDFLKMVFYHCFCFISFYLNFCLFLKKYQSIEFKDIVNIGRTHTQDATPLTLGFTTQVSLLMFGLCLMLFCIFSIIDVGW